MHTPVEIGFWQDPKVLAFAAQVKNPDAGAWILRLREFVLCSGTDDGRLPGYSIDEIAAIMRPTCSPRVLISALKKRFLLRLQRKTWFVPDWRKSVAGRYCAIRKWERERKEEYRAARHAASLELLNGEGGTSQGQGRDKGGTGQGTSDSNKERASGGRPPGAPPKGGRREALTRWDWFKNTHPRLKNPAKCQRLLAELTKEDWEHLQFALPKQALTYMSRSRRWVPWADKYLEQHMFLELKRETPRNSRAQAKADPKAMATRKEHETAEKKASALKFIMEMINDPDTQKDRHLMNILAGRKAAWFKQYHTRPWEKRDHERGLER